MANFSENQVRHLYVAATANDVTAGTGYLIMTDANGEPIRTDLIDKESIISYKATPAASFERKTKAVRIELTSNSAAPIPGEDYIIRLEYRQFVAKSDESFYHEFASAHATSSMSASDLLLELAKNLEVNTKKQELVEVLVEDEDGAVTTIANLAASKDVAAIIVREVP